MAPPGTLSSSAAQGAEASRPLELRLGTEAAPSALGHRLRPECRLVRFRWAAAARVRDQGPWSRGWPARIRRGATSAFAVSCAGSGSRVPAPRSSACCAAVVSRPRPGATSVRGAGSCKPTPRPRSPAMWAASHATSTGGARASSRPAAWSHLVVSRDLPRARRATPNSRADVRRLPIFTGLCIKS